MKKMQIKGEPMPKFFLVLDLVFFLPWVAGPKYSSAILLFLHLQPLHYVCGKYDGLHLSTQNYT